MPRDNTSIKEYNKINIYKNLKIEIEKKNVALGNIKPYRKTTGNRTKD